MTRQEAVARAKPTAAAGRVPISALPVLLAIASMRFLVRIGGDERDPSTP